MSWRFTVGTVAVMLISSAAVACGGDDDATTAAAPTKSEYVKQANAILCTKSQAVAAAGAEIDPKTATPQELKSFVIDGVLPAAQKANDDLSALTPPAGDENEIGALLAELQGAIDTTEGDPAQLVTGPDPFAGADKLVLQYGLSDCA